MKKDVIVICYDKIEVWHGRENAIDFYSHGMMECDGLESERYGNIVADLCMGREVASDGYSLSYSECKERGLYKKTSAPDGSRDYGGKIWYPKLNLH